MTRTLHSGAPARQSYSSSLKVGVVIPAYNEQGVVGLIVRRCLDALSDRHPVRVCVADNGSTDDTGLEAAAAGAEVVLARPRGYGLACRSAVDHLGSWPDVLLFVDADGSSRPEEAQRLLDPIAEGEADLTVGTRPEGAPMTPPQRWGTRLATALIRFRWRMAVTDIGPFRAIRREAFERLGMQDRTWGWTVEMQILAAVKGLRVREVPVSWEARIAGRSKISGTVLGVARAGARILWTIGKYWGIGRRSGS